MLKILFLMQSPTASCLSWQKKAILQGSKLRESCEKILIKIFVKMEGAVDSRRSYAKLLKEMSTSFWEKKLFLRFYERGDKFRYYLIKKELHGKNNVIWGLSACVTEKFNGYEITKENLQKGKKRRILANRHTLWASIELWSRVVFFHRQYPFSV